MTKTLEFAIIQRNWLRVIIHELFPLSSPKVPQLTVKTVAQEVQQVVQWPVIVSLGKTLPPPPTSPALQGTSVWIHFAWFSQMEWNVLSSKKKHLSLMFFYFYLNAFLGRILSAAAVCFSKHFLHPNLFIWACWFCRLLVPFIWKKVYVESGFFCLSTLGQMNDWHFCHETRATPAPCQPSSQQLPYQNLMIST